MDGCYKKVFQRAEEGKQNLNAMNKSLIWAKNAEQRGFVGFPAQNPLGKNFYNDANKTVEEQRQMLFTLANSHRGCYTPIFANQTKCLPVTTTTEPAATVAIPVPISAKALTEPPQKKEENVLLNAVLVGLGIVVFVKLIS